MLERLQKIISAAGVTSRRAAEELIAEGRVRVNGKVVTELGSKADPSKDHIKVDGKLINPKQPPAYILLNKPAGYVTTMSDPEGRPTVHDLIKGIKTRVYPVGRLDYNTEGLLILTNDGDFAHLITHPRHEFPKTYLAKIKGVLDERQIETLEQGMFLKDGKTAPAKVRKVRKEEMNSWIEITIHEGRKRQVRRMFDHVGHSVIKLKRIRTGSLAIGDLPEGRFRHLTDGEVNALRETALRTDDEGRQVRVYKPVERTGDQQSKTRDEKQRPRTTVMRETRTGLRKNQASKTGRKTAAGRRSAGVSGGREELGVTGRPRTVARSGYTAAKSRTENKPGPGYSSKSGHGTRKRGPGFGTRPEGSTIRGSRPAKPGGRGPTKGAGTRGRR